MKYCCQGSEKAIRNLKDSGIAIRSMSNSDGFPIFNLLFRSVKIKDRDKLTKAFSKVSPDETIDFYYLFVNTIIFCPWCGKRLARGFARTWKEFEISTEDMPIVMKNS